MRLVNPVLNLSWIFDCFSGRFDKVVFNLNQLSNLIVSDVPTQSSYHIMLLAICTTQVKKESKKEILKKEKKERLRIIGFMGIRTRTLRVS